MALTTNTPRENETKQDRFSDVSDLNWLSLRFEKELKSIEAYDRPLPRDFENGKMMVTLMLDHALPGCCSDQVLKALIRAIKALPKGGESL